jgi:hypothetical protein
MIPVVRGIGQFLDASEVNKLIDPLVKALRGNAVPFSVAEDLLEQERLVTTVEFDRAAVERLVAWEEFYSERKQVEGAGVVRKLKLILEEVPV